MLAAAPLAVDPLLLPPVAAGSPGTRVSLQPSHASGAFSSLTPHQPPGCRNEPNVHAEAKEPNPGRWHGATLAVTILGSAALYKARLLRYLHQIAVITPYAQFEFDYRAEDERHCTRVTFVRRTNQMPRPPQARLMTRQRSYSLFKCKA